MRQNLRLTFAFLTPFLLLGIPSMLGAQQVKRPGTAAANNAPAGKATSGRPPASKAAAEEPPVRQVSDKKQQQGPLQLKDPIPQELEKILLQWEIESAKIKSLHGKHKRSEFNETFKIEKICEGEFFLQTPDKGRIDMVARTPKKGEVSSRKDPETGEPYELEKGSSERWICNGEDIISFNDDDRTYFKDELPENMRGKNIVHSPLPFLFGMKAADAEERFNMSLISVGKETAKLKAVPRMDSDRQNYKEAWIILDTKRYIPKAVRLIDPNGLETVYTFEDVTINDGGFGTRLVARFRGDPYKPSYTGYTRHIPNEVKNNVEPVSGKANGTGSTKRDAEISPKGRPTSARTATGVPQTQKK